MDDDEVLRAAWGELRDWLAQPAMAAALDRPSVLEGWTVRELVAHLGRSFTTLARAEPTDEAPLALLAYVHAYGSAAREIFDGTRDLAATLPADLVPAVEALAAAGLAALAELTTPVVRGPRGPIRRDDFVVTRLLEVVVHADDLERSVPAAGPAPQHPAAVARVTEAVAAGYAERTGRRPGVNDPLEWIRQATGRTAVDDPALPLL